MTEEHRTSKELVRAMKDLVRAYVNLMENGRDRIVSLGGQCDPVDVMERGDPYLRQAREAIAKAESTADEPSADYSKSPYQHLKNQPQTLIMLLENLGAEYDALIKRVAEPPTENLRDLPTGNVTYHMPVSLWTLLDGVGIATMLRAPKWDGHTAADVVKRLTAWCGSGLETTAAETTARCSRCNTPLEPFIGCPKCNLPAYP